MKRRSVLVLASESLLAFATIAAVFHLWVGVRNPVGLVLVDALAAAKAAVGGLVAPGTVDTVGGALIVGAVWAGLVGVPRRVLAGGPWAPATEAIAGLLSLPALVGLLAWTVPLVGLAPVAALFCVGAMATMLTHFAEATTSGAVPRELRPLQLSLIAVGTAAVAYDGPPMLAATAVPGVVDALLGWLPDSTVLRRLLDTLAIAAACFASAKLLHRGVPLLPRASHGAGRLVLGLGHLAILALIVASPALLLEAWPCPPRAGGGLVGVASEVVELGALEEPWGAGPLVVHGGGVHVAAAGGWVRSVPLDGGESVRQRMAGVTALSLDGGVRADGRCGARRVAP